MNLLLNGGTVCLCRSIEIEDTHKMYFQTDPIFYIFETKFLKV